MDLSLKCHMVLGSRHTVLAVWRSSIQNGEERVPDIEASHFSDSLGKFMYWKGDSDVRPRRNNEDSVLEVDNKPALHPLMVNRSGMGVCKPVGVLRTWRKPTIVFCEMSCGRRE